MNKTLEIINRRRSVRKFDKNVLSKADLQAILEAGRRAPCARNSQKRQFTVVQNKDILRTLCQEAKAVARTFEDEYLRNLANSDQDLLYGASTLIIVSGDNSYGMSESDCAAANQNMLIAAESLGISSSWNNYITFLFQGENANKIKETLGIPTEFKPYCSAIFGYTTVKPEARATITGNIVNYIH